jgi:hypothetical protein
MEKINVQEIVIDGTTYVPKRLNELAFSAEAVDGLPCVLVRCNRSSAFFGYLKEHNGQQVTLLNARRIYYWDGAATLSQLANSGTSKSKNCKFPEAVQEIILTDAIEIMTVTKEAKASLDSVPIWKA